MGMSYVTCIAFCNSLETRLLLDSYCLWMLKLTRSIRAKQALTSLDQNDVVENND